MKILHVVATTQRRGAEIFASDLIKSLNGAGVTQRVAIVRGSTPIGVGYEAPVMLLGASERSSFRSPIDIRALRQLMSLMAEWAPDLVQAHGGEALLYSALASRKAKIVYRRITASPGTTRLRGLLLTALIRQAHQVVAVSEAVRHETIETFHVPSVQVVTIPNGVDSRRLQIRREPEETRRLLGIPLHVPVILYVGALVWEKDPLGNFEIAARVLARHADAFFVVAGDGPMRAELEAAVRRVGLERRVRLLGSRSDVSELLAASDMLLLASLVEGMPAVVIEAGMLSVPVAAYAVHGVPEVVVDGRTGLLAPPGDVESLSSRILDLIQDRDARRAMGRTASDWCRFRFDMGTIAPCYFELYDSLSRTAGSKSACNGYARSGR